MTITVTTFCLIILLLGGVILFLSCNKDAIYSDKIDIYDYPVKPGTNEWKAFTSHADMVSACQIPENILNKMSTAGLIEAVLNYPLLIDMTAYNSPQEGFEQVTTQFNGLQALLNREDAGSELLAKYNKMEPAEIRNINKETGSYLLKFQCLELTLSRSSILKKFSQPELRALISKASIRYREKVQYELYYGKWGEASTALLIGRALQQAQYDPFMKIISENSDLQTFINSGFYLNDTDAKVIIYQAAEFSNEK